MGIAKIQKSYLVLTHPSPSWDEGENARPGMQMLADNFDKPNIIEIRPSVTPGYVEHGGKKVLSLDGEDLENILRKDSIVCCGGGWMGCHLSLGVSPIIEASQRAGKNVDLVFPLTAIYKRKRTMAAFGEHQVLEWFEKFYVPYINTFAKNVGYEVNVGPLQKRISTGSPQVSVKMFYTTEGTFTYLRSLE